ncbi:MAG: SPFH domain-containing protein [Thermodesulfobacteriota bacterium]|nr:SPFH domain-containing protein [Thermodesulfobacteriota bacterium]
MRDKEKSVDRKALQKITGGGLVWLGVAFLVVMIFLFNTIRIGRVTGEQVGVMLNKITGKITIIEKSGAKIYNGFTNEFFVLDKTLQTLDMTGGSVVNRKRGPAQLEDEVLKIKTVDGSDVYIALKVQYKINADMADVVVTTSGPDDNYKRKWAKDYIRSKCRNYLGELTTEEFYDASKRDVKVLKAQKDTNTRLAAFGIEIDSIVIPQKPRFYKEYEEMIKKKKLADQAVLEEKSKALAAKQRQQTLIVEETNKKNVAVEQFKGEMEQKIIAAKAAGEKAKKEGDAYYDQVVIGAGARLYQLKKNAEGILAQKKSEAKGIEALKKALEGQGGRNMVKMEYAKKLKGIKITGKPYSIQSNIERFEHLKSAATTGRE